MLKVINFGKNHGFIFNNYELRLIEEFKLVDDPAKPQFKPGDLENKSMEQIMELCRKVYGDKLTFTKPKPDYLELLKEYETLRDRKSFDIKIKR